MKLNEALSFVFEDERWLGKLLLAAAITLIPVFGGMVIVGYGIAVLRNVRAGDSRPLPSWNRIGEHFVDGLFFWLGMLVYAIPLLILICPIALVWVLPAIAADNRELTRVMGGIAGLISAGLGCLSFLYMLFLWVLNPVLRIRYAETGELAACLRFGEILQFLARHIGQLIVVQLLVWGVGLVISSVVGGIIGVLSMIPICGWVLAPILGLATIPLGIWLILVGSYLYAQIGAGPETGLHAA